MLEVTITRLRNDKRAVSNVIVAMLSLILVVMIVSNLVLRNYQMNQLDFERTQERIAISNVTRNNAIGFELENSGPSTTHIIAIWIINSTNHQRYETNSFVNSGESTYIHLGFDSPTLDCTVKVVTEKGNVVVIP